jgi:hypothetical protein
MVAIQKMVWKLYGRAERHSITNSPCTPEMSQVYKNECLGRDASRNSVLLIAKALDLCERVFPGPKRIIGPTDAIQSRIARSPYFTHTSRTDRRKDSKATPVPREFSKKAIILDLLRRRRFPWNCGGLPRWSARW